MATATTIEDLHPDVLTHAVLSRLDAPSLAAISSSSSLLRSVSSHPDLWARLSLSSFPSLRHLPPRLTVTRRSLLADALPFPSSLLPSRPTSPLPTKLISAVDLFVDGSPFFSRVVETATSNPWFEASAFRIDALEGIDPLTLPPDTIRSPQAALRLSWVVIDPVGLRAANLSSRRPVAVARIWFAGETRVRFGLVLEGGFYVGAVVTCGEGMGHVREVSLMVENADGICLNGRDSLGILEGVMEGERRGGREREEEAEEKYLEFIKWRRERKEKKARREGRLDICFIAVEVSAFLALWVLLVFS